MKQLTLLIITISCIQLLSCGKNKNDVISDKNNHHKIEINHYDFFESKYKYPTVCLDYTDINPIPVITSNGIHYYANDSINEKYIYFTLLDKYDDLYKVVVVDGDLLDSLDIGYIKPNVPLTIFPAGDPPLRLYQEPDSSSNSVVDPIDRPYDQMKVIDFKGRWLKVVIPIDNNRAITGWLSPAQQCSNVYSTCS